MELRDIKRINQRIYELDVDINRNNKMIFVATLIFCLTRNKDFQNPAKLTTLINFTDEKVKPIDQLIEIAKKEIEDLKLSNKVQEVIFNSLKNISAGGTNLDRDRQAFKQFISTFISQDFASIKPSDLFLETLYMEIDKKAKSSDKGVVLTPVFAAQLMIDLAEIDYKKDIIADLCSGTGLFSLLSYSKMLNDMNNDLKEKKITRDEFDKYQIKLVNSIIANDNDPKMVTLCLANFLLKSINYSLLYSEDVLTLQKSTFKTKIKDKEVRLQPTKAILNPPYEDKYHPVEIIEKNINLIREDGSKGNKLVVIVPPQKFGQNRETFGKILNISTLETVIKMQDNLFTDNGKAQPASIFVFNVDKPHSKDDKIRYYDFTDTGYVYLKDSGLVDKNNTYTQKKKDLISRINCKNIPTPTFTRSWSNFYEVDRQLVETSSIDPNLVSTNKDIADISLENIIIKKMLKQKEKLIADVNNNYIDNDGSLEKYIIDILSGN